MAASQCQEERSVSGYGIDKKAEFSSNISSDNSSHRHHNVDEAGGRHNDLLAERPSQGGNLSAFFNIVCVVAGTGTLGLPFSLAKGGWIGVGILVLSMFMSTYTGILIIRCIYYNGHTRLASYQEIEIRGLTRAYVDISDKIWIWICCGVVSIPFVLMKTFKEVSLLSIFGVIATAVLVGVTMVESGIDYKNHKDTVKYDVAILRNLPVAVATISVCFGGNVVYMHVEESMRYPHAWKKVLIWAMVLCCFMYSMVAIPAYLTYGPDAASPILSSLPEGRPAKKVATIMIVAHVLLAAPVMMTSFALEVERVLNITVERRGRYKERLYRTVVRLAVMGVVGGIACSVPYFDSLLSLLGALGNCMLVYVLPIWFYWRLIGWRQMRWYELIWCAVVLIIALLSCVIGSIDAIKSLHRDFTQGR
ncbi:hypothetical protein BGZ65_005237 [Modicella reniformis]|uniref:Amino acid transporter transmembrane domain-containing protein n=1 Tax=Modicella reniformis TaxID=1440133 RepID=A0A9P6LYK5_9FUNG|nr:hypothetical protein BGZ65_005237 [Modicella reniformis]